MLYMADVEPSDAACERRLVAGQRPIAEQALYSPKILLRRQISDAFVRRIVCVPWAVSSSPIDSIQRFTILAY